MKDLIGREIQVGDCIAYARKAGDSPCLSLYRVTEVFDDKIKAISVKQSYTWVGTSSRVSTLTKPERTFILDNFSKELFNNETNNTDEINNV